MTKKNLLKLLNAIADKKDVEFFDSDKWILLEKGWEGMSELLFYIDEVCGNYKNFRIKPQSESTKSTRKSGCYWIKAFKDAYWEIAEYNNMFSVWTRIGGFNIYKDEDFDEIDEKQIKRE